MSGVEVAGLALAVLPLVISAAKHYRDGLGFAKRFIGKKKFIKEYKDELALQSTLLSLYIKAIISRTTLSARTQVELLDDPCGKAWQRSEVVRQLSNAMGEACRPFENLVSRVCALMIEHVRSSNQDQILEDDEIVSLL